MPILGSTVRRVRSTVTSNAVPIAAAVLGAFLLRRLLGTVVSVVAMLAVGRLVLTALRIDLALAEHRARPARGPDAG